MKALVIYDDNCAACRAFGGHSSATAIGYSTKAAKRLMKAQFGRDYGFTLMLFTQDKVYWGSDAAAQASKRELSPLGSLYKAFAHALYPLVVDILNLALRRKTLPRPPTLKYRRLPSSGSMELTRRAKNELDRIVNTFSCASSKTIYKER